MRNPQFYISDKRPMVLGMLHWTNVSSVKKAFNYLWHLSVGYDWKPKYIYISSTQFADCDTDFLVSLLPIGQWASVCQYGGIFTIICPLRLSEIIMMRLYAVYQLGNHWLGWRYVCSGYFCLYVYTIKHSMAKFINIELLSGKYTDYWWFSYGGGDNAVSKPYITNKCFFLYRICYVTILKHRNRVKHICVNKLSQ